MIPFEARLDQRNKKIGAEWQKRVDPTDQHTKETERMREIEKLMGNNESAPKALKSKMKKPSIRSMIGTNDSDEIKKQPTSISPSELNNIKEMLSKLSPEKVNMIQNHNLLQKCLNQMSLMINEHGTDDMLTTILQNRRVRERDPYDDEDSFHVDTLSNKMIQSHNLLQKCLKQIGLTISEDRIDSMLSTILQNRVNERYLYADKLDKDGYPFHVDNPLLKKITSKDITLDRVGRYIESAQEFYTSTVSNEFAATFLAAIDQKAIDAVVNEMIRLGAVLPEKIVPLVYQKKDLPLYITAFLQSWDFHPITLYKYRQSDKMAEEFETLWFGERLDCRAPKYGDMVLIGQGFNGKNMFWIYTERDMGIFSYVVDFKIHIVNAQKDGQVPEELDVPSYKNTKGYWKEVYIERETISKFLARYTSEGAILDVLKIKV